MLNLCDDEVVVVRNLDGLINFVKYIKQGSMALPEIAKSRLASFTEKHSSAAVGFLVVVLKFITANPQESDVGDWDDTSDAPVAYSDLPAGALPKAYS